MILLAAVSTFLLFHLHVTPDNVLVSGVITLVLLLGGQAMTDKMDLEDRLRGRGKYKFPPDY